MMLGEGCERCRIQKLVDRARRHVPSLRKQTENKAKKREIGMLASSKKRSKGFQPGAKVMFVLFKCSGVYTHPPPSVWLLMLPKF